MISFMNELIYDILFCRKDTFTDRVKLLRPAMLAVNFTLFIYFFVNLEQSYVTNYIFAALIISINLSFLASYFLSTKIQHNATLFIPSVVLFILSIYLLLNNEGPTWLYLQLLSLIIINFIGSTRCNVINLILLSSTSIFAQTLGAVDQNILPMQLPIFMLFPLVLYNSFYKTKLTIDHISDISEIHDKELQILEKEALSEIAYNTSIVAHEINNALAVLNANIHLLQKKIPQEESSFEKLSNSSDRIKNIVQLIKNKSYISTEYKDFNLSSLYADDLSLIKFTLNKFNITLLADEVENDIYIYGNSTECSQVLSNLINNAKDAHLSKDNKQKYIKVKLTSDQQNVILTVEDNAGGISNSIIDKIFNKSFTTKKRGEGTGLGLYYVKQVVENMNGEISVDVNDFKTIFSVSFSINQNEKTSD